MSLLRLTPRLLNNNLVLNNRAFSISFRRNTLLVSFDSQKHKNLRKLTTATPPNSTQQNNPNPQQEKKQRNKNFFNVLEKLILFDFSGNSKLLSDSQQIYFKLVQHTENPIWFKPLSNEEKEAIAKQKVNFSILLSFE